MTCGLPIAGAAIDATSVIEVEKKVFLTSEQREQLVASLPLGKEKAFWDVYYDGPSFQLTKNDWWLRQRQGNWELKIPVSFGQGHNGCQSYEEIEDPQQILMRLIQDGMLGDNPPTAEELAASTFQGFNVATEDTVACSPTADVDSDPLALELDRALEARSVLPFCRLHTRRNSIAAREGCHSSRLMVDMDVVTFDPVYAETSANFCEASKERPFVIAEVEMMVPKGEEGEAAAVLENFLAAHDLADAPRAYSKVLEYLLRFRPAHLDALAAAGGVPRAKLEKLRMMAGGAPVPVAAG